MTSYQKTTGHREGRNEPEDAQRTVGWEPAKYQQYYATRALPIPPRPQSSSSSIYDSEDGPRRQPTPKCRVITSQSPDDYTDASYSGPFDEAAFELIRSQSTVQPLRLHKQVEVASPQPRKPDHPDLCDSRGRDEAGISPVTPPATGNTLWTTHTVSPLSESASELDQTLSVGQADRRHSEFGRNPRMHDPSESLHRQIQKINFRFSDPGSPVSAGLDTRGYKEPVLDISSPFPFTPTRAEGSGHSQPSDGKPTPSSAAGRPQISFAGAKIDSFSNRSQPTSSPSRMVPPPLKLRQRSLAESYVKTPFPPRADSEPPQNSVAENDGPTMLKKQHRVSSFGSLRVPHRAGSLRKAEAKPAPPAAQEARPNPSDVLARAQQLSKDSKDKAKSVWSRAAQGLGFSSDEEKKEQMKDELKRKIRLRLGSAQ